jgi:hypothetical protein
LITVQELVDNSALDSSMPSSVNRRFCFSGWLDVLALSIRAAARAFGAD